jgi:hypothetical protein
MESPRQDVDQEASDELIGGECHDLLALASFGAIVLSLEGKAVVGGNGGPLAACGTARASAVCPRAACLN